MICLRKLNSKMLNINVLTKIFSLEFTFISFLLKRKAKLMIQTNMGISNFGFLIQLFILLAKILFGFILALMGTCIVLRNSMIAQLCPNWAISINLMKFLQSLSMKTSTIGEDLTGIQSYCKVQKI